MITVEYTVEYMARTKVYKIQSIVNKELHDKVNEFTKKLGVSQGEFIRNAVLMYMGMIAYTDYIQSKQQNESDPLRKLLEKK